MKIIKIEKLSSDELEKLGVSNWPIWTKEVSEFDWFYDETEQCYFLDGKVIVRTEEGEVEINKGDFVTFPVGLSCTWKVIEPVRKHYRFK
ncbi:MAG: cupin domain-containing protein [Ignavibacteria bacterium]|nr:cupin domain-containing protein [Ignavibacteria bacterium]